jgi:hypothetical protein
VLRNSPIGIRPITRVSRRNVTNSVFRLLVVCSVLSGSCIGQVTKESLTGNSDGEIRGREIRGQTELGKFGDRKFGDRNSGTDGTDPNLFVLIRGDKIRGQTELTLICSH